MGIQVSHEDGPCGDAPSRSLDLPELVAAWYRSQKARPEIIAEMEDTRLDPFGRLVVEKIWRNEKARTVRG